MKHLAVSVSIVVLACVCSSPLATAAGQDPSSPEARAKARELTAQLETQPLGRSAKKARKWLMTWLIAVPDISVSVCSAVVGPLIGDKADYAGELMTQSMFAAAVFVIDHPDQASNEPAKQLAGVKGMLRAYEAVLKEKPKAHIPYLDELFAKRQAGTLEAWVRAQAKTCK